MVSTYQQRAGIVAISSLPQSSCMYKHTTGQHAQWIVINNANQALHTSWGQFLFHAEACRTRWLAFEAGFMQSNQLLQILHTTSDHAHQPYVLICYPCEKYYGGLEVSNFVHCFLLDLTASREKGRYPATRLLSAPMDGTRNFHQKHANPKNATGPIHKASCW